MMMSILRAIVLTIVFAAAGATMAQEASTPQLEPRDALQDDRAKDWSQSHLFPDPGLREQIERTSAFLRQNAPRTDEGIFLLKDEGLLDRRGASKIRAAFDHARSSMARLTKSLEADEHINGWTARMISYELGMAADVLRQQARLIRTSLNTGPRDGDAVPKGSSSEMGQPQYLVTTLTESSELLKGTAVGIVRHLK